MKDAFDVMPKPGDKPVEVPAFRQCVGTNRQGERCLRVPIAGGTVCVLHGGRTPQVAAAAKNRLLAMVEPALDALMRCLTAAPPCETCGRSDSDRDPAVIRAAQLVLDRAGFGPSATVKVDAAGSGQQPWIRWLSNDEYELLVSLLSVATERIEAGSPAFAAGGIRHYIEIPGEKTVCLPANTREPADVAEGHFLEMEDVETEPEPVETEPVDDENGGA